MYVIIHKDPQTQKMVICGVGENYLSAVNHAIIKLGAESMCQGAPLIAFKATEGLVDYALDIDPSASLDTTQWLLTDEVNGEIDMTNVVHIAKNSLIADKRFDEMDYKNLLLYLILINFRNNKKIFYCPWC